MGLNAGLVPPRVDGPVKVGLLELVEHATGQGFSARWACRQLGVDHARVIAWAAKQAAGSQLVDQTPGPPAGEALHALLDWEKDAIVQLAKDWGQVDLSHRKLAHRGSRLEQVYVSESTVLRVLFEAGMRLPGLPAPTQRRGKTPWPDWVELVPGQIYIYDFTHFRGLPTWCAIAVVDVVSRYWLATVFSPEETWVQVQTAFIAALEADGKAWLLEDTEFAEQLATGDLPDNDDRVPALLAVSDNGPQMRSSNTAQFMAIARIAQHFGRPGTPNDQAWIESFFGHLKGENPHLDTITDPAVMRAELDARREHYNTVRLHEGIGYVTPDDEHHGRGEQIRKAHQDGLAAAREHRIATRRQTRQTTSTPTSPDTDI
ncbi:integrase core domain-containing protein [Flexivirga caeni]|uniref:Transposase n=1 Tax=Flexivirga caeni TaxID=2294115 RepID=A0A3M9LUF6_9MICO|nr:integrase core domain-containing protein [Flexivirga caeni]RNI16597.1 transposase [Flexivirga caeni]